MSKDWLEMQLAQELQEGEQEDAWTQFSRGVQYAQKQDMNKAVACYYKAAKQGLKEAQNNLAGMYAQGQGVTQDLNQAIVWYHKAAEQGYAHSQYNLGKIYRTGLGVALDLAQAVVWYRKAAEQGHVEAQYNLSVMYKHGWGVAQDLIQAEHWSRKAAKEWDDEPGEIFETGKGVARDALLCRMEAEQGDAEAQNKLT